MLHRAGVYASDDVKASTERSADSKARHHQFKLECLKYRWEIKPGNDLADR